MPPRVPKGAPSSRSHACWETSLAFRYFTVVEAACGFPTASQATSLAARMYESSSVVERGCPADALSKDPTSTDVKVSKELRRKVQFGQLNLMEPPYPVLSDLDAIFCRNVMIYFDRPTQTRVIASLAERLRPGGYLYVGHSETAQTQCEGLERVAPAVYRRTEGRHR